MATSARTYLAKRYGADAPLRPGTRTKRVRLSSSAVVFSGREAGGVVRIAGSAVVDDDEAVDSWHQATAVDADAGGDDDDEAPVFEMVQKRMRDGYISDDDIEEEARRRAAGTSSWKPLNVVSGPSLSAAVVDPGGEHQAIETHDVPAAPTLHGQSQDATVYRDQRGRKINIAAERAQLAAQRRVQLEREQREMEWGKGRVQRIQEAEAQREAAAIAQAPIARYADDEELNRQLRNRDRWNDPAAGFVARKDTAKRRHPKYTGPPAPPNRFGILPGYRWDGVDRGNGFERELLDRQSKKEARKAEAYKWSTEDM